MSYYYRGSRPLVHSRGSSSGRSRGGPRGRGHRGGFSQAPREEPIRDGVDAKDVFRVRQPMHYMDSTEELFTPKVLGSYSVDSDRDFGHDQSMLNFLDHKYLPEEGKKMHVNLDLNKGWDKFTRYRGNAEEGFQNLLTWILNNQDRLMKGSTQRLNVNFVSLRGVFTKIMRSPYNFAQPWTLYVTEFKGTVYIVNWKRDEEVAMQDDKIMDDIAKWGHTFEKYMCGADPEDGLNANEEYRCVLKSSISGHSLLYAPEVDCADPEQFDEDFEDLEAFVLVKCCKELINPQKEKNHRKFKLNQWWVENRLAGIPRTIVGYRNDDGFIHTLELLKTDDFPEMSGGEWDPTVCFNFLIKFLEYVKNRVSESPGTAFVFERESRGHIYCTELSGKDHIDLLPSWYTNEMFVEEE